MLYRRTRRVGPPTAPVINWDDPLARKLIAAFPLNDGAGQSPRNVTGFIQQKPDFVFQSPGWSVGQFGPCMFCNINSPQGYWFDNLPFPGAPGYSISFWVNSTGVGGQSPFNWGSTSCNLPFTDGNAYEQFGNTNNSLGSYAAYLNKWTHVAFVNNGSTTFSYFNGKLVGANGSASATAGSVIVLGTYSTSNLWQGKLNNFLFYARALKPSEVATLYSEPHRPYARPRWHGVTIPAGGGPVGIVEAGSGAETLSVVVLRSAALSESGVGTETFTAGGAALASVVEAGSASDTVAASVTRALAVLEAGGATDLAAATATASLGVAEAGVGADSAGTALLTAAALSEAGAAADATSIAAGQGSGIAEVGAAADAIAATILRGMTIAEAGAAGDAASTLALIVAAVAESGAGADAFSGAAAQGIGIAEAGAANDTIAVTVISVVGVVEAGAANDAATTRITISAALREAGAAVDTPVLYQPGEATIIEAGSAAETLTASLQVASMITEHGAASDAVVIYGLPQGGWIVRPVPQTAIVQANAERSMIQPIPLRSTIA